MSEHDGWTEVAPRCEACRKQPAPVYAGDGGLDQVYLCERCASDMRNDEVEPSVTP